MRSAHQQLRCGTVGGEGHVVHVALTQQHVHVWFVGVLAHGVSEKDDSVEVAFGDAGCDLGIWA